MLVRICLITQLLFRDLIRLQVTKQKKTGRKSKGKKANNLMKTMQKLAGSETFQSEMVGSGRIGNNKPC